MEPILSFYLISNLCSNQIGVWGIKSNKIVLNPVSWLRQSSFYKNLEPSQLWNIKSPEKAFTALGTSDSDFLACLGSVTFIKS